MIVSSPSSLLLRTIVLFSRVRFDRRRRLRRRRLWRRRGGSIFVRFARLCSRTNFVPIRSTHQCKNFLPFPPPPPPQQRYAKSESLAPSCRTSSGPSAPILADNKTSRRQRVWTVMVSRREFSFRACVCFHKKD